MNLNLRRRECYFFFRVVRFIVPTLLLKCLQVVNTFREKDRYTSTKL
jgi:hypothetical protein